MSADLYRAAALHAALAQYSLVLGWSILVLISLIMVYFIEFSKSITHQPTNPPTDQFQEMLSHLKTSLASLTLSILLCSSSSSEWTIIFPSVFLFTTTKLPRLRLPRNGLASSKERHCNQLSLNFTRILKDDINTLMYIHPIQFGAVALYDIITLSHV